MMLGIFLWCSTVYGQQNIIDGLKDEIQTLSFNKQDTLYITKINELATHIRYYNIDSLLILAQQSLELSRQIDYPAGEATALCRMGDYFSDQGDQVKSVQYYSDALTVGLENGEGYLILRARNHLANQHKFNGDYAKALEEYLLGVELAKQLDNKEVLVVLTENIALLYGEQNDFEQALYHFKTVKKLNDEIGNDTFTAISDSNMGSIYADMGELEYAMYHVNRSISVFEKHEMIDWLAFAYQVKGKAYLKQKKYKWSLFWYNQSKSLYEKGIQDERSEIQLLNGIAEANMGIDNDSLAKTYALSAMNLSTKLKENEGLRESANVLYQVHKKNKDFETALEYHESVRRLSDSISKNENSKNLVMLKTKLNHEQQKADLIAQNEVALARQKNYIYASIGILLVLLGITLLIRRNEKIQKKLNKELNLKKDELEKNEVELREINETKDKLFSIIGHDLRGPIGAFQGLLQLFRKGEVNQKEFLNFIPKLRSDIDHISFTLNNLLSWGQTQMNGAVTKASKVSLENLVDENVNLLSEIAEKKSIKVLNKLVANTLAWSDADQIDIVIRNLISNALKFTPQGGSVTIDAKERNDHWEISVQDTGVGMDLETQSKIFCNNSTVTTYGTNNEKGTGLGLSLCKEMVENNKGTIWVESSLEKGTSFYFTVPKTCEVYEKAS